MELALCQQRVQWWLNEGKGRVMIQMVFIVGVLLLSACSSAPLRTGTVYIHPVDCSRVKNKNPLFFRPDMIVTTCTEVERSVEDYIPRDTQLILRPDCTGTDYELMLYLTEVNITVYTHLSFQGKMTHGDNEISMEGVLRKCGGPVVAEISADSSDEEYQSVIEDLGEIVATQIRRDPTVKK